MTGQPTTPPTVVHVHNTNYAAASATARAPAVPPPRKSIVVAYLAWALGCYAGIHRPDSGVVLYLFPELVGRPQLRDPATRG